MLTHHRQAIVSTQRALPSRDQLVTLASSHISAEIDTASLFFFPAEISNTQADAYFTHMHESSLVNYASDSRNGVSVLDSHDGRKLGIGYSLTGKLERTDERIRVVSVGYTLPDINFGGQHSYQSTNDFIRAVLAGVVRDVSIGFYGGRYICDLCGGNYQSYRDCPHIAGREYDREEGKERCTVAVHDAHLSEYSLVYDGATPDAMLLKAESYAGSSAAEHDTVRFLETSYRINLNSSRRWSGVDSDNKAAFSAENAAQEEDPMKLSARALRTLATFSDYQAGEVGETHVEAALTSMEQRINELVPLADDGKNYRETIITNALAAGVRALGDGFDQEAQRAMLESMSLAMVENMRTAWDQIGDAQFGGGRQVNNEEDNGGNGDKLPTPLAAIAA